MALFLSEAEINSSKDYSCLNVNNYNLHFSKTLKFGKARTAAYIHVQSGLKRVESLEQDDLEIMVFENNSIILCGVYRPFKLINGHSSNSAFVGFIDCLKKITSGRKSTIIGGDFNIDWHKQSVKKDVLEEWAEESGLLQLILPVTRRRQVSMIDGVRLQESCLDLVFAATPLKVEVIPSIQSDHDLVQVHLKLQKPPITTKKVIIADWRNYSAEKARYELSKINLRTDDCGLQLLDSLTSSLIEVLNKVAPKKVVKVRGDQEIVNAKISAVKKKRDRMWKKYKVTGDIEFLVLSRSLTKSLKNIIAKEKKRTFRAKVTSHGGLGFWKAVGEIFNVKSTKEDLVLDVGGRQVTSESEVADLFSDYFVDKVNKLASKSSSLSPTPIKTFSDENWQAFSLTEVTSALKMINHALLSFETCS